MRRALVFAVLVAMLILPAAPSRAVVIEEIAAWVNGQIITRSELLEREEQATAQLSSRYVGEDLDRELDKMRSSLLTDMMRETILLQRAEILGLELDRVYQQALTQLKEQQNIKTNEELEQVLKQEGITKDELRKSLLRYNVPDIMVNLEVRDKIAVSDQEVSDYYAKHTEEFRVEESFSVREIVLTQEDRTTEALAALAAKVIEESKAGTPFNELVVKYSQAPSRFKDGLIGPFKKGDLSPEIENVALKLAKGAVSDPITTKAGIHIIMLESHVVAAEPSLEAARPSIVSRLKQEKFTEALDKYFKMLMDTNLIEVNRNYKQYDRRS